jgi:hypothetical protein
LPFQQSKLVITNSQGESFSAIHSSQAHRPILFPKGEGADIVSGTGWGKFPDWLTICLVRFSRRVPRRARIRFLGGFSVARNPSDSMDRQLSRQPKSSPDIVINQRLHRQFISQIWRHNLVNIFASSSKRLKSSVNLGGLLRRYLEFAGYCQDLLHGNTISHLLRYWWAAKIYCSRLAHPLTFRDLRLSGLFGGAAPRSLACPTLPASLRALLSRVASFPRGRGILLFMLNHLEKLA